MSEAAESDGPEVLGSGIRIPEYYLRKRGEALSNEEVTQHLGSIRNQLEEYLEPDEPLEAVYSGIGTSFGGAGSGLYVFGATDRRFVILDQNGRFAEVDYDAVTTIDRETDVFSYEVDTSRLREIGIGGGAMLVFIVLMNVFTQPVFALGFILSFFGTAYMINRHWKESKRLHIPFYEVVIRTPNSTDRSVEVEADTDWVLGTTDVNVRESESERYVIRQWMSPEEAPDTGGTGIEYDGVETFGDGTVEEPRDLETRLSKIVRKHRD
ncbi:hypothetical protein [Halolamina salina]|uniref:PH domain-containing protein n=2 Tax=Halolamina salina TaxID=1220023 RepID=A0ABD6B5M2_9EURY